MAVAFKVKFTWWRIESGELESMLSLGPTETTQEA